MECFYCETVPFTLIVFQTKIKAGGRSDPKVGSGSSQISSAMDRHEKAVLEVHHKQQKRTTNSSILSQAVFSNITTENTYFRERKFKIFSLNNG